MPDPPLAVLPDEVEAAAAQHPVGDGAAGGDVGHQTEHIEEPLCRLAVVGDFDDGIVQGADLHGAPAVELLVGVALQVLGEHRLDHLGLGFRGRVDGGVVAFQGRSSGVVAAVDPQGHVVPGGPQIG